MWSVLIHWRSFLVSFLWQHFNNPKTEELSRTLKSRQMLLLEKRMTQCKSLFSVQNMQRFCSLLFAGSESKVYVVVDLWVGSGGFCPPSPPPPPALHEPRGLGITLISWFPKEKFKNKYVYIFCGCNSFIMSLWSRWCPLICKLYLSNRT